MFTVAQVSDQIQSNHIAWSAPVGEFETVEEAKEAAAKYYDITLKLLLLVQQLLHQDWENVPEGNSLGYTYIVHDYTQIF
jgi:hypothetical protein